MRRVQSYLTPVISNVSGRIFYLFSAGVAYFTHAVLRVCSRCQQTPLCYVRSKIICCNHARSAGYVVLMLERRDAYKALVEKSMVKRPLEKPKSRWEDNIKISFNKRGSVRVT